MWYGYIRMWFEYHTHIASGYKNNSKKLLKKKFWKIVYWIFFLWWKKGIVRNIHKVWHHPKNNNYSSELLRTSYEGREFTQNEYHYMNTKDFLQVGTYFDDTFSKSWLVPMATGSTRFHTKLAYLCTELEATTCIFLMLECLHRVISRHELAIIKWKLRRFRCGSKQSTPNAESSD